jgi:hypothetical protein
MIIRYCRATGSGGSVRPTTKPSTDGTPGPAPIPGLPVLRCDSLCQSTYTQVTAYSSAIINLTLCLTTLSAYAIIWVSRRPRLPNRILDKSGVHSILTCQQWRFGSGYAQARKYNLYRVRWAACSTMCWRWPFRFNFGLLSVGGSQ